MKRYLFALLPALGAVLSLGVTGASAHSYTYSADCINGRPVAGMQLKSYPVGSVYFINDAPTAFSGNKTVGPIDLGDPTVRHSITFQVDSPDNQGEFKVTLTVQPCAPPPTTTGAPPSTTTQPPPPSSTTSTAPTSTSTLPTTVPVSSSVTPSSTSPTTVVEQPTSTSSAPETSSTSPSETPAPCDLTDHYVDPETGTCIPQPICERYPDLRPYCDPCPGDEPTGPDGECQAVPPPPTTVPPPPDLGDGTLPATGMRPSGWGAFWVGVVCLGAGLGLVRSTRTRRQG